MSVLRCQVQVVQTYRSGLRYGFDFGKQWMNMELLKKWYETTCYRNLLQLKLTRFQWQRKCLKKYSVTENTTGVPQKTRIIRRTMVDRQYVFDSLELKIVSNCCDTNRGNFVNFSIFPSFQTNKYIANDKSCVLVYLYT